MNNMAELFKQLILSFTVFCFHKLQKRKIGLSNLKDFLTELASEGVFSAVQMLQSDHRHIKRNIGRSVSSGSPSSFMAARCCVSL